MRARNVDGAFMPVSYSCFDVLNSQSSSRRSGNRCAACYPSEHRPGFAVAVTAPHRKAEQYAAQHTRTRERGKESQLETVSLTEYGACLQSLCVTARRSQSAPCRRAFSSL